MNNYDEFKHNDIYSFVDYVIKKTEENTVLINKQKAMIELLKAENERLKKLEDSYNYINSEIRKNAEYEAELIIKNAKDNASIIVNDALIKAKELENEKLKTIESLDNAKKEMKKSIEILEDIELL